MRIRFSLAKLFFCVAAYAVPLGLLSIYGFEGLWHALAVGTSLTGVILLTNDANLRLVMDVYVGGILGAFIGCGFSSSGLSQGTQESLTGGAVGALVGGLIAGVLSRHGRPPSGAADSSAPPGPPRNAGSD